jgi:hypothetical protein
MIENRKGQCTMKQRIVGEKTAGGFHRGWENLYTGRLPAVCLISIISAGRKHRDTHFIQRSVAETICATVDCHYGVKPGFNSLMSK